MTKLSIIIPCYNEEKVINKTIKEIVETCSSLNKVDCEYIFINDGSNDKTFEILKEHSKKNKRIKILSLSRNFGHQIALTAGIEHSTGDVIVIIDADLQDPPALIEDMLNKWKIGYDVVYAKRRKRKGETKFKLFTSKVFYKFLSYLSEVPIPHDTGDFRLMSREICNVLISMPEKDRFVRGMVSWVGYKQTEILYDRDIRFAGETKYPLNKMVKLAIDGVISFSSKPLRIATVLGFFVAFLSLLGIFYAITLRLFTNTWVEGWTAIMIAMLFLGGMQMIILGILGEYIGRVYNECKGRPLYVLSKKVGFDNNK